MTDFIDYLKSKQHTYSTIESYTKSIGIYFTWLEKEQLESEQITYNDLLIFVQHCGKKGIKQRTIQSYLVAVKHYYDHLIQQEIITTNPASDIEIKGIKRKQLYHLLKPHELHNLYNQYNDESLKGRRNKVMLGLLVYQGLRTTELSKLEVNHIQLREGQIDVLGGKRSNGRVMKLESHQVMDLYDYVLQIRPKILTLSKQETNQLLVSPSSGTDVSSFITRLMVQLRKKNPNVLNANQLRASVITKWLKVHNLREVQHLAGHRYISSTESFLENEMEGLQEEVQQFHPMG